MRKEKALINLLRGLTNLVGEEAARNPEFAARLERLLTPLPERHSPSKKARMSKAQQSLPDIYAERSTRGDSEFRLWLRGQPITILRGLIRQHDLDATRRTRKWNEPEKLSEFIADQIGSRLARGSSFLRTREDG